MKQKINPQKKFFNTQQALEKYGEAVSKVGLWKSEQLILEKYASKESKIIDIGCGAGRTTFSLYRLGYRDIIGIDIADILIDKAKDYCELFRCDIRFEKMDASNMSYQNNTFDIALFSYNGLTGIPTHKRRLDVVNEIYRVLKPGGYFIFTAHDRDEEIESRSFWIHEKQRWQQGKNNDLLYEYGDVLTRQGNEQEFLHYYSRTEMLSFIGNTRFQVIEIIMRKDLAIEDEKVKNFSRETCFWVLKK